MHAFLKFVQAFCFCSGFCSAPLFDLDWNLAVCRDMLL